MKKLLSYYLFFLFLPFLLLSQTASVYDFDNLTLGDINNQDGWHYSTSLSTANNGYNCPVIGTPLIPQIVNMPTVGEYISSNAIQLANGWQNQYVIISRLNNSNWSIPSIEHKQYLILSFDFKGGCWDSMLKLAYDENGDGNFGQNCGQLDPNEASIGLSWSTCGGNSDIFLHDATSQPIAQAVYSSNSWTRCMLVIDFYANNNQGSISVYSKNLETGSSWQEVSTMQKINCGFDNSSNQRENPKKLNGIILGHEANDITYFDNISFNIFNFKMNDTTICFKDSIMIGENLGDFNYKWNTNDTVPTIYVSDSGHYNLNIFKDNQLIITDTVKISFNEPIKLGDDTTLCESEIITIKLDSTYSNYIWNEGSNEHFLEITEEGSYHVKVNKNGCILNSDTINIKRVLNPIIITPFEDTLICDNAELKLYVEAKFHKNIEWFNFEKDTSISVFSGGIYWVKISNECGEVIDSIEVLSRNCECIDFIPNSFTPNNDKLNDTFGYYSNCEPILFYELKIFDRWGQLLFASKDYLKKWNGFYNNEVCKEGVYFYHLQKQNEFDNSIKTMSKTINIIQ